MFLPAWANHKIYGTRSPSQTNRKDMEPLSREQEPKIQPPALALTAEQTAIINSTGNIKINAVAGSGKTTTIQYAASRPKGSKILYLAFNKSVRLEAKRRFAELGLGNVQVETAQAESGSDRIQAKKIRMFKRLSGYRSFRCLRKF